MGSKKFTAFLRSFAVCQGVTWGGLAIFLSVANGQERMPTYKEFLGEYQAIGAKPVRDVEVIIQGESFRAQGGGKARIDENVGGEEGKSAWWGAEEGSWLEWELAVPESGLYNIGLRYYPGAETTDPLIITRSLTIDGKTPFQEANDLRFPYAWAADQDEKEYLKEEHEEYGEELPAAFKTLVLKYKWRFEAFSDPETALLQPYLFFLTAGKHTIRLISRKAPFYGVSAPRSEPMAVDYISVHSPPMPYADVASEHKAKGLKEARGVAVKVQGEDYSVQGSTNYIINRRGGFNEAALYIRTLGEPNEDFYNDLGLWKNPGHWVEWEFEVPEDGLYKIVFKYSQGTLSPIPKSGRNLKIDGRHPFAEMAYVPFEYTGGKNDYLFQERSAWITGAGSIIAGERDVMKWQLYTPSVSDREPYLFYLKAGKHTLYMQVVLGPALSFAKSTLTDVRDELLAFIGEVEKVAERSPKENIDLVEQMPGISDQMKSVVEKLDKVSAALTDFAGGPEKPAIIGNIDMVRESILSIASDPDKILTPEKLDAKSPYSFRSAVINQLEKLIIGRSWTTEDNVYGLGPRIDVRQSLDVDYLAVTSPDVRLRLSQTSAFKVLRKMWREFIASFKEEEDI